MENTVTRYLAANGRPFSDPDAATFKANRMSEESGDDFHVVEIGGGYAVEPRQTTSTASGNGADQQQVAASSNDIIDEATINQTAAAGSFIVTLRPAWRAQVLGFLMILLGAVLVIAPTWPIALFSTEAVYAVNGSLPGLWDDITLLGFLITLIGLGTILWKRYYQHSVITNVRVMQSVGILFNRHVSEIDMANIHVVDVKQPNLLHMILNIGTVELSTPGSGGADVAIVDIVSPRRVAAFVRGLVDRPPNQDTLPRYRSST